MNRHRLLILASTTFLCTLTGCRLAVTVGLPDQVNAPGADAAYYPEAGGKLIFQAEQKTPFQVTWGKNGSPCVSGETAKMTFAVKPGAPETCVLLSNTANKIYPFDIDFPPGITVDGGQPAPRGHSTHTANIQPCRKPCSGKI
jgi:hypothetical protein